MIVKRSATFLLPRLAVLAGCSVLASLMPSPALAADVTSTTISGGGTILSYPLGSGSLSEATAALLRRVHTALGSKPNVGQTAQNAHDRSVALLFTASRGGTPVTGVALVTTGADGRNAGTALYDTSAHFGTSLPALLARLKDATTGPPPPGSGSHAALAPAEPLVSHPFTDGTGSVGVPAGWSVQAGGGGSVNAAAPGGGAQVSYNLHYGGLDPSNPRAQMFLKTASPMARAGFNGIVAPYTGDPVQAWKALYEDLARKHGFEPSVTIASAQRADAGGVPAADIAGTLGTGAKTVQFIAHVFLLPPNPMGMWTISDSHIFLTQSQLPKNANTAMAVLNSIRINFGAVAAEQAAVRAEFQKQFDASIARDRQQDLARYQNTQHFLASDRAAQEGMHRQAVAMENYALDRTVVVDVRNGDHATLGANFADTLVEGNANYRKVPASQLLRGVDY